MATDADLNEKLREYSCVGVVADVRRCLENGAEINSQNNVNAWTALHWAAKRGHKTVVELLLKRGADPSILNDKGQLPVDLTESEDVKSLLQDACPDTSENPKKEEKEEKKPADNPQSGTLSFVPGYLANPVFPYAVAAGNPMFTQAGTSTATVNANNEPSVLVPGYLANPVLMTATKPAMTSNGDQSADNVKPDQQVLVPGYLANPVFPCAMATGSAMQDPDNEQSKHENPVNFVPGYIMGANNPLIAKNEVPEEFKQIFVPHVQQLGSLVNTYVNVKSLEKPVELRMYNSCKTTPVATVFVSTPVNEIVLKIRVADTIENDFIEVELNSKLQTYDELINVCCKELNLNRSNISKIRKLPNTIIRRDKDVKRLQPYQELEVILN